MESYPLMLFTVDIGIMPSYLFAQQQVHDMSAQSADIYALDSEMSELSKGICFIQIRMNEGVAT